MLHKLAEFQWPFIAATAAIMVLAFAFQMSRPGYFDRVDPFFSGLIVGGLLFVMLYAAIRHVLEVTKRGESRR
jgi:hypothetical protein